MKRLVILSLLLAVPGTAWAYNLIPGPLRWEADPNTGLSTTYWYVDTVFPPSMDPADVQPAMQRSYNRWQDLSCSTWTNEFQGDGMSVWRGFKPDTRSMVTFEDPNGDLGPGIFAANVRFDDGTQHSYNGMTWYKIYEMDTVFNSGWKFATQADVVSGCEQEYNIEQVATHEFGHGLGYDHSCEQGEPCGDPDEAEAVMFWSSDICETNADPRIDDQRMHSLVYGANQMSEFTVQNAQGGLPLAVDFLIETFADATNLSAIWDYGDNNQETAVDPTHTYTEEGKYTVSATITGDSASCYGSTFTHEFTIPDAVLACPDANPRFTYTVDGKSVHFVSQVDGSGIGCINDINWDFGDGGTAQVPTPIHNYEKYGTYEVSFAASGIAGAATPVVQSITLSEPKGCKCSVTAPQQRNSWGLMALAGLLGAGLWIRRRRLGAGA